MTAVLLDTNAVSDVMRSDPRVDARVAAHSDLIATSVVAVGEVRYGIDRLPLGKRRANLEARAQFVLGTMAIEPVDNSIAERYGDLKAYLERVEPRRQ
jgi:predicted nucleic acid-binding protein